MTEYVRLGSAFVKDPEEEQAERVLDVLAELRRAIAEFPAPEVHVEGVSKEDVGQIVQSVLSLMGPDKRLSEEELAAAIVRQLPRPESIAFPEIPPQVDLSPALDRLSDRLGEQMNVLRGIANQSAQAFGSSGPSNIADNANRQLGIVSITGTPTVAVEDGGNVLSVDDGGSSLTVDGTVTASPPTGTLGNGTETSVTGTAAQVLASGTRKAAIIQNTGLFNVRIGASGVTATTGMRLAPGDSVVFDDPVVTSAIFAIREGSSSSTVLAQEIT